LTLTRDSIRAGIVQEMVRRAGLEVLSDEELRRSREAMLAARPRGDVWVFGYGSLIWNPAFHFAESVTGRVHGWHRRFCLWTHAGRGTPENPGLLLGLERGGSCRGVAFRVRAHEVDSELDIVWRREMVNAAYVPRWVDVRMGCRGGERTAPAIAFVINRRHDRYAGLLAEERVASTIASARGRLGPCADYLLNTAAHLEQLGIRDRALERLRRRVLSLDLATLTG
jgi:glutathione-specific gamma-glutamylcyclotransferase